MDKTILVLDGLAEGKTSFIDIAKDSGFWIWNINHRNVLSVLARKIGWDGNRDKSFYDFIEKIDELANSHFNHQSWYTVSMIEKFLKNNKANILVIHNCSPEISKNIQEDFENCYSIFISDDKSEVNYSCKSLNYSEDTNYYCKTLNYKSKDFKEEVVSTLNIITNNKEETEK